MAQAKRIVTPKWVEQLATAYARRGWSLRVHTADRNGKRTLLGFFRTVPEVLLMLLQRCGGMDELKANIEHPVLYPAKWMVAETRYSRESVSPSLQNLIIIGRRAEADPGVYFVMEERANAQRVGVYWGAYDEVEWVSDTLDEFLRGLSRGRIANSRHLAGIDLSSRRAEAARARLLEYFAQKRRARARNLDAPARPGDWRAHVVRAFDGDRVRLAAPGRNVGAKLASIVATPPRVLLELLSATDGIYSRSSATHVIWSAANIVKQTREARETYGLSTRLLVIGWAGADGILFVMREGSTSNAIGAYDPIDAEVTWLTKRLSDFLNRWAEGSLSV